VVERRAPAGGRVPRHTVVEEEGDGGRLVKETMGKEENDGSKFFLGILLGLILTYACLFLAYRIDV
jgi:hypothetical protein